MAQKRKVRTLAQYLDRYSQRAAAKLLGVSQPYVSQLVRGLRKPGHRVRVRMQALGIVMGDEATQLEVAKLEVEEARQLTLKLDDEEGDDDDDDDGQALRC